MKAIFIRNPALRRVAFFFPIQLLLVTLKKNHFLLLFWALVFGFITEVIAPRYGVPYLFLNPEYLGEDNFWSYLITGFGCGGFIIAFNISSYINNAFRFPFLATLSNPFYKFCINNSIIPLSFIITYVACIYRFLIHNEFASSSKALFYILGFLVGIAVFAFIAIIYFNRYNKDIVLMFGMKDSESEAMQGKKKTQRVFLRKNMQWKNLDLTKKESRDWHVETYVSGFTKIRLARAFEHYDKEMLLTVFRQNHFNAAVFELIAIATLIVLGLFREIPFFEIPAGASVFLLFTMILMLGGALNTLLRGWATSVAIILLLTVNFIYHYTPFSASNNAYGLNYKTSKADFSYKMLKKMDADKGARKDDVIHALTILEKWKKKNNDNTKPKLVLINTSGGGLRSALWTFYSLQYADSILGGKLMKHIELITGSSGGMVGAAYLRELYMQQQEKKIHSIHQTKWLTNISNDILNPVAFSIATNDLFFRFQHLYDGHFAYSKDRGYAFEYALNRNTGGVLQKRLIEYYRPESEAIIPMMVMAPTIINDGRKLLISPQPISYLTQNQIKENIQVQPLQENIEFTRFFEKQNSGNLWFTSALRMNATFPYISPIVSLPSEPEIEVMDAGMRDNYGLEISLKFLYSFQDWIKENTSGVVILQIRDRHKEFPIEKSERKTIGGTLARPLGSFYGNWFFMQDFNQQQEIEFASLWFPGKIDILNFQLRNEQNEHISLSWHLTKKEKLQVKESINLLENQETIRKLKELLE